MPTLKHMIITTSMKGGGGKSTCASALVDFARRHQLPMAAYDADQAVGSLSDMHATRDTEGRLIEPQDPLTGVVSYNIRDESRGTLFDSLQDHALALHDLAGGALVEMQRLFGDQDSLDRLFCALEDQGAVAIFMHLITPDASTVESVAIHLDLTEKHATQSGLARHVAVLNRYGGRKDEDFPHWFGYTDRQGVERGGKTRQRLLNSGGAEMDLPALDDRTMAMLKDLKIPFDQGVTNPALTLVHQQRIRNFTREIDAALSDDIRTLLGLGS